MSERHFDFNSCSPVSIGMSRLEYVKLVELYPSIDLLKQDIVDAIWNDERLLREDISDIAHELLNELNRG